MRNNVFKSIQSSKGFVAIQSDLCPNGIKEVETQNATKSKVVSMAWCSPYASLSANQQLERDLRKIYIKYYIRVLIENFGLFW